MGSTDNQMIENNYKEERSPPCENLPGTPGQPPSVGDASCILRNARSAEQKFLKEDSFSCNKGSHKGMKDEVCGKAPLG